MFAKLVFVVAFSTILAAAQSPAESTQSSAGAEPSSPAMCNTGPVQCCNELQSPTENNTQTILSALGLDPQAIDGQIGLECNPINVIGLGSGADCSQHPVCCSKTVENSFSLIAIDCVPINIDL
ncbi:type 1 hydrophobin [Trametes coccinea BRFM310]|uniref:Hydrophobin n=1 Tax=Trametes coccinea (strain BRFM310) TaxID=1353009 RepID=A0A1Y2IQE5_TRAC3|nr:type 1 hydrophobin [Trametes coccinea BRFM310]